MTVYCRRPEPRPQPLYFVEHNYGKLGIEFVELDRDRNSLTEVVKLIRNGSLTPVKILEVIEPCDEYPRGQVTDVTAELCAAAEQQRDPKLPPEAQELIDMLHDHARDLKKHGGIFGW